MVLDDMATSADAFHAPQKIASIQLSRFYCRGDRFIKNDAWVANIGLGHIEIIDLFTVGTLAAVVVKPVHYSDHESNPGSPQRPLQPVLQPARLFGDQDPRSYFFWGHLESNPLTVKVDKMMCKIS
jgi:hypothetical protein